ncbi:MAG: class I tRNA ligase family protein, partial [Bacteroidia bacterium]|nr:class I tRNA ligase family protein [Bacteroidia bacterium]
MGLMLSAPAGNDLLFDESLCEQGRNFCNKLWNSFRLIQGWETTPNRNEYYQSYAPKAHQWIESRMDEVTKSIDAYFDDFRISDALMELYKLTRDDFSGWYLEMIKPNYGDPIPAEDLAKAKGYFDTILRLLHPFMPFITEELWQELGNRQGQFINQQDWPKSSDTEKSISENVFKLISEIRAKRNENGISPKVAASIAIQTKDNSIYQSAAGIIEKLANVESLDSGGAGNGFKALVGTDEVSIGFKDFVQKIDTEAIQKEIGRLQGFLIGIDKKLGNEKFIANANPAVIEKEQQKKADTLSKIESLKGQLK